jgi:hypothetical protein
MRRRLSRKKSKKIRETISKYQNLKLAPGSINLHFPAVFKHGVLAFGDKRGAEKSLENIPDIVVIFIDKDRRKKIA